MAAYFAARNQSIVSRVSRCSSNPLTSQSIISARSSTPSIVSASFDQPSRSFHSTPVASKLVRLLDTDLSELNKGKRNKKQLTREIAEAPGIDPAELMSEAEYMASRRKARIERKHRSKDFEHPYSAYNFTITVIGRPNVGKSSLFNRLIGRRSAIVDGASGVTRDYHDSRGSLGGIDFRVIDTAGLEEVDMSVLGSKYNKGERYLEKQHRNNGNDMYTPFGQAIRPEKRSGKGIAPKYRTQNTAVANRDSKNMTANYALGRPLTPDLQNEILELTRSAVEESDVVLFVVDAKTGLTPVDEFFAQWLRRMLTPKPPTEEQERDPSFNASNRQILRSTHTKPVILLANKFDYGVAGDSAEENLLEFASLGFGDPVPFSSIHGTGIGELYNNMVMSMTSVLKQWDAYQRRITAMQVQIREEQRAAAVALLAGEDGVAADADRNSRRIRTGLKVVRSSLRPSKKSEIEEMEASSKAIAAEIAEEQARIVAEAEAEEATLKVENDEGKERVRVVVAGKPNVGKSTLINGLLGQDRLLTGPQAGITRDSIAIKWRLAKHPDHIFELVDTAGIRGVTELAHSRFDRVDSMAMNTTVRAISYSNVVVLVLDVVDGLYGYTGVDPVFAGQIHKNFIDSINPGASASRDRMMKAREQKGGHKGRRAQKYDAMKELTTRRNPDKQAYQDKLSMLVARVAGAVTKHDMDVARLAAEHGKALVVLANKVDLLKGGAAEVRSVLKGLETLFTFSLAQNKGVTVLPVSALTQSNLDTLPDRIVSIYDKWNTRINTGLLNRWLRALTVLRPPPSIGGKKTNLKYATQTNIRPPTFAIFASRKTDFPEEYVNFLTNSLREEFGFHGIPIRVHIRTGDNPYMENRVLSMSEKRAIARRRIRERVDEKKSHRSTQKRVPSNRLR